MSSEDRGVQVEALPEVLTNDDERVRRCTDGGVGHDWRPHEYLQFNRPHTSWRCVWCHGVACGNYGDPIACMEPYHHDGDHKTASGTTWPKGGLHPEVARRIGDDR